MMSNNKGHGGTEKLGPADSSGVRFTHNDVGRQTLCVLRWSIMLKLRYPKYPPLRIKSESPIPQTAWG